MTTEVQPTLCVLTIYIFQEAEKKEWTQEEQTRLEQALRTYGPKEEERWDKIQKAVPTRTKRECKFS